MKKILLSLIGLLLLAGCVGAEGKLGNDIEVNENIRKDIAEDSYTIVEMVAQKVNEGNELDIKKIARYEGKYYDTGRIHYKGEDVTPEEDSLILHTLMISNPHTIDDYVGIGSNNDKDFDKDYRSWYETLKTGEININ